MAQAAFPATADVAVLGAERRRCAARRRSRRGHRLSTNAANVGLFGLSVSVMPTVPGGTG